MEKKNIRRDHPLGLYLHIPFCKAKCAYCDFYSLARSEEKMDAYTAALQRHLVEVAPQADCHIVDTVYFGGGTPSYLGVKRLTELLKTVKKHYRLAKEPEITVEANPDSACDWKALRALRRAGVNRLSILCSALTFVRCSAMLNKTSEGGFFMASSKRKKHGAGYVILIAVLILVLLAVVAAVTGYSLVARRVKALQAGAAFTFDYEITSTADSPALYTILQKTGSTKGTVDGLYAPDALQLSISAPDAVIPAGPLTRVYISSSETLYDVGQLYKNIRSSITGSYPLASLLLPDWSLGSYISQAQLASLLGVDTTATSLQDMTEFELPQKKLQRVQPENAKDGYLYFQLDTGDASTNAPVLVIGLEKSRFFADAIPVHILLTIPEHGVSIQLTGTVSAQTVVLTAPTSRMKDEDIQTLVQIRDTIQSVLQFVQTAANSVQNAG